MCGLCGVLLNEHWAEERGGRRARGFRVALLNRVLAHYGLSLSDWAGSIYTLHDRKGRPLFLIDLAVPRDLDPAIHELDGCYLYDIDDLEAVVAETLAGRRREGERAETIVAAEADRFSEWQASLDVVPAIASLRARAEQIRTAELAKLDGRLSDSERRTVESVTAQILNKLLHLPTVRMKQAAAAAEGATYADAVRHLFGLEDDR